MYFVRQAWANSVDPNAVSHQGLQLFATHPAFLDTTVGSKLELQILDKVW